MGREILAERIRLLIPRYEEMFSERGEYEFIPDDPMTFHLYHLARYWSRLVGFCRLEPDSSESFVNGDGGACVKVGTDFADGALSPDSPIKDLWQDYLGKTQALLLEEPASAGDVEAASQAFDRCLTELGYDPWS